MTTITLSGGAALTTEQKTALRVEIGAQSATDVTTAASNAIAAHIAAADPHAQYLTQSEADALYAPAGITGATNLTATASPTGITVNSDTGTDAPLPLADSTNAGLMAPEQVTKLGGVADGATANATDAQLRDRTTHTGEQPIASVTGLQAALDGKAATGHGHAVADVTGLQAALDGKADLVGGKLPASQLPDLAVVDYLGAVGSQAAMLALTGQKGDWCTRTDLGTTWVIIGTPSVLAGWTQLSYPAAPVTSVAGRTGAVTLSAADISGLGTAATTAASAYATAAQGTKADSALQDLAGMQSAFNAGTSAQRSVFQSSVSGYVNALSFGVKNDGTATQAQMDALLASSAQVIYFPPGTYYAEVRNLTSNRTFWFAHGAVIDGTVHLVQGSGPDTTAGAPIVRVSNVTVIGQIVSTVRVGGYYGENVKAPYGIRILGAGSWPGQAAAGGASGVHWYFGCRDFDIGDVIIEGATATAYAFSCDTNSIVDAEHRPTRLRFGRYTLKDVTGELYGLQMVNTTDCSFAEVNIQKVGKSDGLKLIGNDGLRFGKIIVNGTGAGAGANGIYVDSTEADLGAVSVTAGIQGIGLFTTGSKRLTASTIDISGCVGDNIRLQVPGHADLIRATGSTGAGSRGVAVLAGAEGFYADRIEATGNNAQNVYSPVKCRLGNIYSSGAVTGVYITGAGATVGDIDAASSSSTAVALQGIDIRAGNVRVIGTGAGNGLDLSTAIRIKVGDVDVTGTQQGLRCTSGSFDFGHLYLHGNVFGIVGVQASITGWTHKSLRYSSNTTYDSNIVPQSLPGFGALLGMSVSNDSGDADKTITIGDATTQRWLTPLTANRTVTPSTAVQRNGARFRIMRGTASTGAFTLTCAGKSLATGQWMDIEDIGGAWVVTAFGSL